VPENVGAIEKQTHSRYILSPHLVIAVFEQVVSQIFYNLAQVLSHDARARGGILGGEDRMLCRLGNIAFGSRTGREREISHAVACPHEQLDKKFLGETQFHPPATIHAPKRCRIPPKPPWVRKHVGLHAKKRFTAKNNFPTALELCMQLPEQLQEIYAVMKGFEK